MKAASDKSKKRILITGGSGFIGWNLVQRLQRGSNFNIVILDWEKPPVTPTGINFYSSDIADPRIWEEIEPCDYVFHAAAQISAPTSEEEPVRDFLSNAYGTFLVAEYARKYGAKVIYCNSMRVYDPDAVAEAMQTAGKVSEACGTVKIDSIHSRHPPFALSKYIGEQYLGIYARKYGVRAVSHRMSGIVGPGQIGSQRHAWVSNLVRCAVLGQPYTIFGDGKQTRDILHVNDLIDLIISELDYFDNFVENGFVFYNVGGGPMNRLSLFDVIKVLEEKHNMKLSYKFESPREGDPKHYATDLSRIGKKGWRPKEQDPKQIIAELVDWYQRRKGSGNK